jgi:hypothetical protein
MNRWVARAGFAIAVFMVPWCLLLAYTLPSTETAAHWSLAWVGLDALEGIFAGLTALCVLRRDRRAAMSATVFGALLSIDAWFDLCTSGFDRIAVLEAVFVEIPLAVGAFAFAYLDNKRFERLLSQHVFRGTADHRPQSRAGARPSVALAHSGAAADRGSDDRYRGERYCRREPRELLLSSTHPR